MYRQKMKSGSFELSTIIFGMFRLDGGAMFGSVPKNLWGKIIPVDEENCIPLASRSLLIRHQDRVLLVDVGLGEKWSEKSKQIFAIQNNSFEKLNFNPKEITDVILTHLHFDHAGGISKYKEGSTQEVELVFPQATVYLQEDNFANAQKPSLRERASYLSENVLCLHQAKLKTTKGTQEIFPGITVHQINGHTRGQQWIEVNTGADKFFFATDLIPTARHLPVPYVMGYDICAETAFNEKAHFLQRAVTEDVIVVFQHDPDTPAARVGVNEKGHYCVKEKIDL